MAKQKVEKDGTGLTKAEKQEKRNREHRAYRTGAKVVDQRRQPKTQFSKAEVDKANKASVALKKKKAKEAEGEKASA